MTDVALRYEVNERVLFTALPEGGVLLDLVTKTYFSLNETAAFLWGSVARERTGRDELIAQLVVTFEVEPEQAAEDVDAWVREMKAEGLLREARA